MEFRQNNPEGASGRCSSPFLFHVLRFFDAESTRESAARAISAGLKFVIFISPSCDRAADPENFRMRRALRPQISYQLVRDLFDY